MDVSKDVKIEYGDYISFAEIQESKSAVKTPKGSKS